MTTKDALKQIKQLLSKFPDKVKFELVEDKLVDGTLVYYDLATKEIYVLGADGQKSPAPVGQHELANGEIVIVTEEGKIAEIKKKTEAPEVEVEVKTSSQEEEVPTTLEEVAEEVTKMKKKFEDVEKVVEEQMKKMFEEVVEEKLEEIAEEKMKKKFEDIDKKLDEMSANFSTLANTQKMTAWVIEEFAKKSSSTPVQHTNTFQKELKKDKDSRYQNLQSVFQKLQNNK